MHVYFRYPFRTLTNITWTRKRILLKIKQSTCINFLIVLRCPFSAKMFNALKELKQDIYDKVLFKIIQVPQPWHPASCVKHLAARAVMIVCEKENVEVEDFMMENCSRERGRSIEMK